MKASQEDVQRVLHIAEPFFDDLRKQQLDKLTASAASQRDLREEVFFYIRALDSLRKYMKTYATAKPAVSADTWNGLPMENENG